MSNMRITSTAFDNGEPIPAEYTCDGTDTNPPLAVTNVPSTAESLVLLLEDPDVPERMDVDVWDHWVVYDIPAEDTQIKEGEEPTGVHGIGTSENKEYKGPCPPDGQHRYFFTVYALDTKLQLQAGATKKEVEQAMGGHILAEAELMGTYDRG